MLRNATAILIACLVPVFGITLFAIVGEYFDQDNMHGKMPSWGTYWYFEAWVILGAIFYTAILLLAFILYVIFWYFGWISKRAIVITTTMVGLIPAVSLLLWPFIEQIGNQEGVSIGTTACVVVHKGILSNCGMWFVSSRLIAFTVLGAATGLVFWRLYQPVENKSLKTGL